MSKRAVNWLFLVYLFVEAGLVALVLLTGIRFSVLSSIILTQVILLVPTLIFLLVTKTKVSEMIPHKKLHPVTPLLCIVYTGLCMPLILVVNMISLLFVDNEATRMAAGMMGLPGWVMILAVGILGPVNEEFLFRGTFYGSYRKTGRILAAMFMSAFLFGLTHLNFNQMSYAIVMGILAVLLIEATGSIVSSMILHACINTFSVLVTLLQRNIISEGNGNAREMIEEMMPGVSFTRIMLMAIFVYGMIALAATTLAVLLLVGISYIEKRNVEFFNIFKKQKKTEGEKKETLWSIPLGIAVVLSFAYMIIEVLLPA
ncbi:MAG: CPBP family intramembrane metalloprotease [Lachnospiraceae bacterium]|nr:CPBP family intramembrane metalloprotease [Lachnospiraceae bacterium]